MDISSSIPLKNLGDILRRTRDEMIAEISPAGSWHIRVSSCDHESTPAIHKIRRNHLGVCAVLYRRVAHRTFNRNIPSAGSPHSFGISFDVDVKGLIRWLPHGARRFAVSNSSPRVWSAR